MTGTVCERLAWIGIFARLGSQSKPKAGDTS
jgi:hypothetical protein